MRLHHAFQLFIYVMPILVVQSAEAAPTGDGGQAEAAFADSLPQRWAYSEHFDQAIPTEEAWWRGFNDPTLDALIEMGVKNNFDVLMAARRMEMARLSLLETRAGYFPQFDLTAGWTKSRTSGALSSPTAPARTSSYFNLGLSMSWQLDVFGKITAAAKAQKAAWQASKAEYAATMVTLAGNIATAYISLRVYQAEKEVAVAHLESQQKVVKITEARFEAGIASMLEVAQAKSVYFSTESTLPALTSAINKQVNALAVLLAVTPADAHGMLDAPAPIPSYLQMVATGIPMDLLRRRPDVVEAEQELAMYAAQLGVAKKDFLPTLTLEGSIGTSAHRIGDMFSNNSLTYAVAPTLSWTLFDGMKRKYAVQSAREAMQSAVASYNLTLLQAVTEVDNSMCNYVQTLKRIASLDQVVEESRKSLDLSLDLYKRGLAAFTNVVDAQLDYLTYSNDIIIAKGQALTDLIELYEALGGGWDASSLESSSSK